MQWKLVWVRLGGCYYVKNNNNQVLSWSVLWLVCVLVNVFLTTHSVWHLCHIWCWKTSFYHNIAILFLCWKKFYHCKNFKEILFFALFLIVYFFILLVLIFIFFINIWKLKDNCQPKWSVVLSFLFVRKKAMKFLIFMIFVLSLWKW